jgi:hypothetical protein
MKLSPEQQRALRRAHGICANEACDSCRKVLGSVRWTRRGEPGEWCSDVCRDGSAAVELRQARRAGRPRLKLSAKDRIARRRRQIREAVSRHRLSVIKNGPQPTEDTALASAISHSGYPHSQAATAPVLEALR